MNTDLLCYFVNLSILEIKHIQQEGRFVPNDNLSDLAENLSELLALSFLSRAYVRHRGHGCDM